MKRCKKLEAITPAARTAKVIDIQQPKLDADEQDKQRAWFDGLISSAFDLHRRHCFLDKATGKQVSIGVMRLANVNPCIELSKYMLACDLPSDIDLRLITYHARQVMLIRSLQEAYLDALLNRKQDRTPLSDSVLRSHLAQSTKSHVVFIVVASPVAEVGRDHDYDWAVIEPSSMRSIIQMAGRIRRHRNPSPNQCGPNIAIANYNYVAFVRGQNEAFVRPGFEGGSAEVRDRGTCRREGE